MTGRRQRGWLAIGVFAAVLLIAAASIVGSGAALASTSANPSNVFTVGNLHHTNSKPNTAILTASPMKPGDTSQGAVTITNDRDRGGTFSLSTSNLTGAPGVNGGKLCDVLQLRIIDQTTGRTIYSGAIKSVGTVAAGTYAVGAAHTYQFTVTFPDGGTPGGATTGDNAQMGSSLSIEFHWDQVQ